MTHFNKEFWLDTAERAVKTAAQAAIGVLGTGAVGLLQIDWTNVLSVTLMAALISILTSIASAGGETVSPASLIKTTQTTGRHIQTLEEHSKENE
ncbi:holin [Alloscardovia theropitheci]|uniref:Holin n=1 Tax=Alloscardovia theropitheci TaxID=2496842 RepID=A0A4R0QWA6_9BIFI|nr:holin [Alloscardovia theropitheci]TCD53780.1 holin [Alloscardovia theropitheci]